MMFGKNKLTNGQIPMQTISGLENKIKLTLPGSLQFIRIKMDRVSVESDFFVIHILFPIEAR